MVNKILTASGVKHRRNRFTRPPSVTYVVWMDDIDTDGADGMGPCIFTHNVTFEVYEYSPDDDSEAAIEAALGEAGMHWTRQDRVWIEVEQLYQVIYEFSYVEKRRN